MKSHLAIALLGVAAVSSYGFSQGPDTPPKVDEKSELQAKLDALGAELTATRTDVTALVRYAEAQSRAAAQLVTVLDEAERAGFVAGINPDSRKMLLAGWRESLAVAQRDLPTAPVVAAPKTDAKKTVK
jgi:hypothetical protein